MGPSLADHEAFHGEKNRSQIALTQGFWMMEAPVTQAQYKALMGYDPSFFQKKILPSPFEEDPRRPVERVSWYEAIAYCNAMSEKMGLQAAYHLHGVKGVPTDADFAFESAIRVKEATGWRLPTEAEWEYACRAGTLTPRYGEIDEIAWYDGNSSHQTHPVGQKQPNAYGFYDLLGQVYEWTYDIDDPAKRPYSNDESFRIQNDPMEPFRDALAPSETNEHPSPKAERVCRGGAWYFVARYARASARISWSPNERLHFVGFRIVKCA